MQNINNKLARILVLCALFFTLVLLSYLQGNNLNINSLKGGVVVQNKQPDVGNISDHADEGLLYLGEFTIVKVVDGDTFDVVSEGGEKQRVRLLAVNTPESYNTSSRNICLSKLATEYTKNSLLNKQVVLFGDKTQPKEDKYGRLLAYAKEANSSDGEFFNDKLMIHGYSKVYKASPVALYYDKYLKFQKEAQDKKLMIWNMDLCK